MSKEAKPIADDLASSVDFSELILGFSSAALYYLGESAIDGKKSQPVNLPLAKQNIEIVAMLERKTEGNLTSDESALVRQVLADLRVKYLAVASARVRD